MAVSSGFAHGALAVIIIIIIGAVLNGVATLMEGAKQDQNAAYSQGMEDLAMGRYINAIEEFDKVLEATSMVGDSRRAQAYIGRGRAKTALRNYDLAIKDFDKALKLNPEQEIEHEAYSYRAIAVETLKYKH